MGVRGLPTQAAGPQPVRQPRQVALQVRKVMLEAVPLPTPALPDQPTPHTSAHQAWARTQLLSKMASLPTVSEGRRDQCEAPSDPKFPDCAGKVEVRPGAEGGGGDQPGVSSETVLLAGLSTGQGPSAQPQPLTLALGGRGQPQGNASPLGPSAWPTNPYSPGRAMLWHFFLRSKQTIRYTCATANSLSPSTFG